jgi:hypothetical protein
MHNKNVVDRNITFIPGIAYDHAFFCGVATGLVLSQSLTQIQSLHGVEQNLRGLIARVVRADHRERLRAIA